MAFRLLRNDEPLPERNLIILIFGEPGVSKTSLSFTADNPVLLGYDAKGLDRAVGRKDAVLFDSWADSVEYVDSGEIEKNGYKTVITDTGGAMLDQYMTPHILKMNEKYGNGAGGLGLSGYGVMKSVADTYFNKMESKGVDLIFICHSETEKEGDNMIRYPKMTGGARDILVQKADLIGYMEMRNNKITLEFSPTQRHAGKNCANFPILEIPHFEREADKFKNYMAGIIKQTKDHMRKQNEAQLKALKHITDMRERIAAVDSIEKLDAMLPEIEPLSPVYKSQAQQFYSKKYADIWGAQHFNPETVKTPDDFATLADIMKSLPKNVLVELYDPFRKLVEAAGLVYIKDQNKYVPKDQAHKATPVIPNTGTAPSNTNTTPAAASPKTTTKRTTKPAEPKAEVKEEPKPAEQKEVSNTGVDEVRDEQWFLDRVGTQVKRVSKDNKEELVMVTDNNRAVHMAGVMQHHQGFRFYEIPVAKEEDEPAMSTADSSAAG